MRYVLLLIVVLLVLGTGGFVWLGWYGAIAPIQPPARASFAAASIVRGAQLAALGDCMACHTAPDGSPFAGGRPLQTPFGAIYASNITPDPATGIGTWSEAAFHRALHQGVDRGGRLLYPAFPFDHFTLLTPADDADLYAYLMTRQVVHATTPPNDLPFPLSFRPVLALWRLLFFRPATFHPDAQQSVAWNRGAYLVQGVAHCAACHTERNFLGATTATRLNGGMAQGWYAYPLDKASPAPEHWNEASLYAYLRHGWQAQHGDALGPMAAVTHGLATLPDDDVRAIATYIAASEAKAAATSPAPTPVAVPAGPGAALYHATCAMCHDNSRGPPYSGMDLALSSAVHASRPDNLANLIVQGIPAQDEQPGPIMPGFGPVMTDRQIAELMDYLRARFGTAQPWDGVTGAVQRARSATAQREAAR